MIAINDAGLLKTAGYIDGRWHSGSKTFPVNNPANGDRIADVADLGPNQTEAAISAAVAAFEPWRNRTAADRAQILCDWAGLLEKHRDDLARIMTTEQGKPLAEAAGEINYTVSFFRWFAEEAKRVYGDVIPSHHGNLRNLVIKQPVGVVAAITPWNFPIAMVGKKLPAALAAGCTMVWKPSEETPLSALALAELGERAGLPHGVFNVIPATQAAAVGKALTDDTRVRKVSFTGSTAVGKILLRQSADTVKRVSMELGGNAPFLVFDDADIDAAVAGAVASKFRNAGQTCVCANRILVQDKVYDEFAEKFRAAVGRLAVGNGLQDGVAIGPLINQAALAKVEGLVADALERGAKLILGGARHSLGGTFYEPTIMTDVPREADIAEAEIFGPVAPLYRFSDEGEAIQRANDTPFGLAAYFFARDVGRVWRVSEALEYGMIGVNTGMISTAVAPFGGIKQSGLGREGSRYGLDDYLELKFVCMGGIEG